MREIRPITIQEVEEVSSFVRRVFDQFIAPGYSAEGRAQFYAYIRPDAMTVRLQNQSVAFGIWEEEQIVACIEIRDGNHIALLFTDALYQQRGLARKLMEVAQQTCPTFAELSVNASPFAVGIYEKLGFIPQSEERVVNGIRFTPMVKSLQKS